jgi:hypothetical protein
MRDEGKLFKAGLKIYKVPGYEWALHGFYGADLVAILGASPNQVHVLAKRSGRADRLADSRHLVHQPGEPLVPGHLAARLLQLRPGFQVHVHGPSADAAGQVPLRPVAAVTGLRARAVRLAALAPVVHPTHSFVATTVS